MSPANHFIQDLANRFKRRSTTDTLMIILIIYSLGITFLYALSLIKKQESRVQGVAVERIKELAKERKNDKKKVERRTTPIPTTAALIAKAGLTPTTPAQQFTGTQYFVSPHGSDATSGKTAQQPFKTIQKALDTAQAGDIINLADGKYVEKLITKTNGKSGAPITIKGSRNAVLTGAGSTGRVFEINHDYIVLDGFTIDGKFGSGDNKEDYNDKLIYVLGKEPKKGPTGLKIKNMLITNAGGECVRLRYFVTKAEIANNTISNCGVHDFQFPSKSKNGEGIYVGTSSNQWEDGKNPTSDPDETRDNIIHDNVFNTQGNECVDIKEGATNNIVENNDCSGQKDDDSAGLDSRGDGNTFRNNKIHDNLGAGVRLGGNKKNGVTWGKNNNVYDNEITGNKSGGIKFQATPQDKICGNKMSNNNKGNSVGSYGDQFQSAVTSACQ